MSSLWIKLKTTKKKVVYLLEKYVRARSSDRRLVALFWWHEVGDKSISFEQFLKEYVSGKYTDVQTIERCRRKIQESREDLRGQTYKARQANKEYIQTKIKTL